MKKLNKDSLKNVQKATTEKRYSRKFVTININNATDEEKEILVKLYELKTNSVAPAWSPSLATTIQDTFGGYEKCLLCQNLI